MDPKVGRTPSPITTSALRVSSSIGSSPRSALQEERREQLAREFHQIDADQNNYLSYEEVHKFLSDRQDEPFDETLCRDLFERMDKNKDNQISLEEFIDSYTDTEEILKAKIKEIKKSLKKKEECLEENTQKLRKCENKEIMTASNIMEGSVVTVVLKDANGLTPTNTSGLANPFVILKCGLKEAQSSVVNSSLSPSWNETFTFPINERGNDLLVSVKSKGMFGETLIGKVAIPVISLSDQLKHEQFYQLTDEKGGKIGKVKLELQWIWSKVVYFKDLCKELRKIISDDKQRLTQIEEKLENLKRPFGVLTGVSTPTEPSKPLEIDAIQIEDKILKIIENTTKFNISTIAANENYVNFSLLAYMLVSVFICFCRPDFFNLILSIYAYVNWVKQEFEGLKTFTFLLLVSEIFDFFWIYCYASQWGAVGGVSEAVVWVSFWALLMKLPLTLVFWKKSRSYN